MTSSLSIRQPIELFNSRKLHLYKATLYQIPPHYHMSVRGVLGLDGRVAHELTLRSQRQFNPMPVTNTLLLRDGRCCTSSCENLSLAEKFLRQLHSMWSNVRNDHEKFDR